MKHLLGGRFADNKDPVNGAPVEAPARRPDPPGAEEGHPGHGPVEGGATSQQGTRVPSWLFSGLGGALSSGGVTGQGDARMTPSSQRSRDPSLWMTKDESMAKSCTKSSSSVSAAKDCMRTSSGPVGLTARAKRTCYRKFKDAIRTILFFRGRLGPRVHPVTLSFLDKDMEEAWISSRAKQGSKAFWWMGSIILVYMLFDVTDRTAGGLPIETVDGQLVLLPVWLSIALPFVYFTAACTPWGRKHSVAVHTVAFFLYCPLFLLYSTRARTKKITEFLLERPLAFDFSLFSRREMLVTASQPVLLLIAFYAVGVAYVWSVGLTVWVALWWTVFAIALPPVRKHRTAPHENWTFFLFTVVPFVVAASAALRFVTIASRFRFALLWQAEKDLEAIRQQALALVAHSPLADLLGHITKSESILRELKLAFPTDFGKVDRMFSSVLIHLEKAQICFLHLDEHRPVDPLSGIMTSWAVNVSAPGEPFAVTRDGSRRAKSGGQLCARRAHSDCFNSPESVDNIGDDNKNLLHVWVDSPSEGSSNDASLRDDQRKARYRKRSGDFLVLGRRSGIVEVAAVETSTVDLKRRAQCSNYINVLLGYISHEHRNVTADSGIAVASPDVGTDREPAERQLKEHRTMRQVPSRNYMPDAVSAMLPQVGRLWDMDVFALAKLTGGNVLPTVGFQLRRTFLNSGEVSAVDMGKWCTFIREISIRYRKTSYHNETHAGTVAHLNVCLLRHLGCWHPLAAFQQLAVVISALVHDVGHFGVNNTFLTNSNHPLAVTYNDRAVLENFHVSVAFRTMLFYSNGAANVLEHLSPAMYKATRSAIIELVLETDLSSHFDFLTRFRLKVQLMKSAAARAANAEIGGGSEPTDRTPGDDAPGERWMIVRACIRCADIGHSGVEWDLHYRWSRMLVREFFAQGKQEAAMGLAVSPMCDAATADVPKSQVGFIRMICQPLFETLNEADSSGTNFISEVCLRRMDANVAVWQRVADSGCDWSSRREVAKYAPAPSAATGQVV